MFGANSLIYRAPGRVNVIGEHTDYNQGFVMPAAIDRYCRVAIAPRADRKLVVHSEFLHSRYETGLSMAMPKKQGNWSDYPVGVAAMLLQAGYEIKGANLLIASAVPLGAGLSSSAALEVAAALALLSLSGKSMSSRELALLCQRAENEYVGAHCGIMDQFIAVHGRAGQALLLDCRSLAYELVGLPANVELLICNTMVRHELAASEYNSRRSQCEEGVRRLATILPHVHSLRDVTLDQLEAHGHRLGELIYKRCRHVITENHRTQRAAAASKAGDIGELGRLMAESHRSLRDDYEVSCPELDLMVDIAQRQRGLYGARMTGGGFGGCTINLVDPQSAAAFQLRVAAEYESATGRRPDVYLCKPAQGAGPAEAEVPNPW